MRGDSLSFKHSKKIIIDARYPYEFEGGHIIEALNIYNDAELIKFMNKWIPENLGPDLCIIVHCEYSSKRGPRIIQTLRSNDRVLNREKYPDLYFPELYLLENGYNNFFNNYPELCCPQSYIKMDDKAYSEDFLMYKHIGKTLSHSTSEISYIGEIMFDFKENISLKRNRQASEEQKINQGCCSRLWSSTEIKNDSIITSKSKNMKEPEISEEEELYSAKKSKQRKLEPYQKIVFNLSQTKITPTMNTRKNPKCNHHSTSILGKTE